MDCKENRTDGWMDGGDVERWLGISNEKLVTCRFEVQFGTAFFMRDKEVGLAIDPFLSL
jgi:hypothetical protein